MMKLAEVCERRCGVLRQKGRSRNNGEIMSDGCTILGPKPVSNRVGARARKVSILLNIIPWTIFVGVIIIYLQEKHSYRLFAWSES